jgi:predicted nuclease of restriction endonuclease-like RecB superfamily
MQTLLFNCTKLDFYVSGGTSWKDVLRNVKRLGLMYNLQQRSEGNSDGQTGEKDIVCSLDGPMSLFKLTDRYGTSIAKLLPSIVSSKKWYIDSWIVRKTMAGRKIYQFKISDADVPKLLTDPYSRVHEMFDSAVEEKFASRFEKSATGWQLIREPDPIVVSGGKALIPDFMFEKYNKRVYLEIIGFWTKEYLERKVGKMLDVAESGKIDLFVAVNEELGCSKLSSLISKERLILYKGDSVPIKPILDYLKSIDREFIERKVADPEFRIELDPEAEIISINELARKNGVPEELVSKVASKNDRFVRAGMYLISKSKADKLKTVLEGVNKFAEACVLLSKNGIPEDSHADLVSKLGYSVMWQSMDPGSAIIRKAL